MTFAPTSGQKHSEVRHEETSAFTTTQQETCMNSRLQESSLTAVMKDQEPISACSNVSIPLPYGSKTNSHPAEESSYTEQRVSVVNKTEDEYIADVSQSLQAAMSESFLEDKMLSKDVGVPISFTSADKDSFSKIIVQCPIAVPVPMPRVKKRLSASLPDDYQVESGMTEISTGVIHPLDNNEMSSEAKVPGISKASDCENKAEMPKGYQSSPTDMSDSQRDITSTTDMQRAYKSESGEETKAEKELEQIAPEIEVKSIGQVKPTEPLLLMPRMRKRFSASFNDDIPAASSPPPCVPDQGQKEAHPPVPAPRSKKRLSATYPDENPPEENQVVSIADRIERRSSHPSDFSEQTVNASELENNKSVNSILVTLTKGTACAELSSTNHESSRQLVDETVREKVSESAKALTLNEAATSNASQNVGKIRREEERSSEKNQDVETTVKDVNQGKGEDKVQLATVSLDETAATLGLKR